MPGTFTDSPAAGTVPGVGNNQTLSATFAAADSTDASGTATLDVLPAAAMATYIGQDATTRGIWTGT